tara:strand:+ start:67 stop:261 length:195 start_codon:yes stop_codon:yes gene_type:complete
MDIFHNCIKLQNLEILKKIADEKFINQVDKDEFIKKYNKINYQLLKTVKEDMIPTYEKKIKKIM